MNQCLHFNVCQDGVNDFDVGVNESIFFSFVWRMTHMNAQKCYRMLIEMQRSWWNLIYAQMLVFSRLWMYLRTIGRLFKQMISYLIVMNSKRCKITVFRKHSMHKGRSLARGVHLFDAQWENNQVTKKVRFHVLPNNTNFISVATVFESKNIRTHVKFPDKVLLLSIIQSTINFI